MVSNTEKITYVNLEEVNKMWEYSFMLTECDFYKLLGLLCIGIACALILEIYLSDKFEVKKSAFKLVMIAVFAIVGICAGWHGFVLWDEEYGIKCGIDSSQEGAIYRIGSEYVYLYDGSKMPFPEHLKGKYEEYGMCRFSWSMLDAGVVTYQDMSDITAEELNDPGWWGDDSCIFGNGVYYGYYYP